MLEIFKITYLMLWNCIIPLDYLNRIVNKYVTFCSYWILILILDKISKGKQYILNLMNKWNIYFVSN